jgi:hypothetical protein
MSENADFVRRERITDALIEFERRIRERTLAVDNSECWDLLLNRPPVRDAGPPRGAGPAPLRYETREGVRVLRVIEPGARNCACLTCDLFGRSHCCGGLTFLYYALRDSGISEPLSLVAVEVQPGLWLPDWELMAENSSRIAQVLWKYFEAHLASVDAS